MAKSPLQKPNPKLDLVLERVIDVPRNLVWEAWTQPEHVKAWFSPRPWRTLDCEIDLQPGGIFRTVMQAPAGGEEIKNVACYLEIVPNERLVWTDTLLPGWRPADSARLGVTVIIAMESLGSRTRYIITALHRDEASRKRHEDMGMLNGWGTVLDQLVGHIKGRTVA